MMPSRTGDGVKRDADDWSSGDLGRISSLSPLFPQSSRAGLPGLREAGVAHAILKVGH